MKDARRIAGLVLAGVVLGALAHAQPPAQPPAFVSPEVQGDRKVAFRIHAPNAQTVRLVGSDMPQNLQGTAMTKGENGVWEVVLGPIDPGAYRYNFNVDGVTVIDPRNPKTSESNNNTWSLFGVEGEPFMDTRNVPRGAVASVTYYSTALSKFRRMHVYTPPGYELGAGKFPVFYLLHGAGDCDDSWTTVGRAGFILDNLLADKKAKPMIVVMPAGHVTAGGFRQPTDNDDFSRDFLSDVMPYVEKNYRVLGDRGSRAIAGLSMGGNQTLNIAIPHLAKFGYVGVFSSGLLGSFPIPRPAGMPTPPPPPPGPTWEEKNKAALEDASVRKGLKLFWFSTGKDDFLVENTRKTVEFFKAKGWNATYDESAGAHTWINWRNYLNAFAPRLFQGN